MPPGVAGGLLARYVPVDYREPFHYQPGVSWMMGFPIIQSSWD